MAILTVISLGTGVAVFMLGMLLMKYVLENSLGKTLGVYLKKFTSNRFSALLTGAFVTMGLQSSSASSVLTAALVDSGILSLYSAFWIIVGANTGTTFTGLLTALSLTKTAPLLTVVGVGLISFTSNKRLNTAGVFLSGAGLLFVGLDIMGRASQGISEIPLVADILIGCDNPVTGVLMGCLFTALIQSSSAVTALLQTLGADGIIGTRQAFYIILGSNIGTCATCAIASMGLKNGAKKVSVMHILYNFFGAVLFVIIAEIFPLPEITEELFNAGIKTRIAVLNILFNVSTAVIALLLPVKEKKISLYDKFSYV